MDKETELLLLIAARALTDVPGSRWPGDYLERIDCRIEDLKRSLDQKPHERGMMSRSPEYTQGKRAGIKWAITWLHERANEMNDEHAKGILNTAAFNMGGAAKRDEPPDPYAHCGKRGGNEDT